MNFTQFEILAEAQIVVVGGGPAGFAAALAAARNGAKVLLVEQTNALGGMATSGLVPMWAPATDEKTMIYEGIFREINEEMCRRMGITPWREEWQYIDPEILKALLDEKAAEAGIEVIFDVKFCAAEVIDDKIAEILIASGNGLKRIKGQIFIDATGNGQLAFLAGAKYKIGDENNITMSPTLCGRFSNIDHAKEREAAAKGITYRTLWKEATENGTAPVQERHFVCMKPTSEYSSSSNLGHIYGADTLNELEISRCYRIGREQLHKFLQFFRANVPGYEKAELVGSAAVLGVRETRRIECDYTLTVESYFKREHFDDEIGRCCYMIDVHASSDSEEEQSLVNVHACSTMMKPGESYGIPFRSIVVKGLKNLLVPGRAMSCDRLIQSSIRVMPPCFVMGQAAGVAAALAQKSGTEVRQINIQELQRKISEL